MTVLMALFFEPSLCLFFSFSLSFTRAQFLYTPSLPLESRFTSSYALDLFIMFLLGFILSSFHFIFFWTLNYLFITCSPK